MPPVVWSQRTFLYRPQTNGLSFEITHASRCLASMMEVTVAKRRRSWEWQVRQNGTLIMHGRERSRPAARYQGYRSLFMLLAVGRRPVEPRARIRPASETSSHAAGDLAHLQRPARPLTPD